MILYHKSSSDETVKETRSPRNCSVFHPANKMTPLSTHECSSVKTILTRYDEDTFSTVTDASVGANVSSMRRTFFCTSLEYHILLTTIRRNVHCLTDQGICTTILSVNEASVLSANIFDQICTSSI